MGMLKRLAGAIIWSVMGLSAAGAQPVLPDHRYVTAPDTDFYGTDLGQLFDTTRAACARACDAQPSCVAFTFNTRSNACFPKSEVTRAEFFAGALSARKRQTPAAAQALAAQRRAALGALAEDDIAAARALVQTNADRHPDTGAALDQTIAAMQAAIARGDTGAAARFAGSAVALTDRGDLWAQLAWLGLRARGDTPRDLARQLEREAVPAALNAYLRAATTDDQVTALDLMARALEENRRGRDMIVNTWHHRKLS